MYIYVYIRIYINFRFFIFICTYIKRDQEAQDQPAMCTQAYDDIFFGGREKERVCGEENRIHLFSGSRTSRIVLPIKEVLALSL